MHAGLREAREAVSQLIGAQPADVAFAMNSTACVNMVVASIRLQPGDLLLLTSLTYPAVWVLNHPISYGIPTVTFHQVLWRLTGNQAILLH